MRVIFFFFFFCAGNNQNARAGSGEGSWEVWRVWRVDMKEGGRPVARGGQGGHLTPPKMAKLNAIAR